MAVTAIGSAATKKENENPNYNYISDGYKPTANVTAAQQAMQAAQAKNPGSYTPGTGVTAAQQAMQAAQASNPGKYSESAAVNAALQAMQQAQAARPAAYSSKYGAVLDNILAQIQNPKDFKYEFNGDNLFKAYADLYTQQGRQASMNAMGQATALTGGYGNSYAQQVGNQAYDQYLLSLYDKGLDLRDRAYQQHQDERADLYNQYGTFSNQDQIDYGRYRDTVQDWKDDRSYYTDRYDTERNFDYGKYRDEVADYRDNRDYATGLYQDERNFDYGKYRDEVADYRDNRDYATQMYQYENNFAYDSYKDKRDYDEKVREFESSLEWDKMSQQQKYAAEYCAQILASGQMPPYELLLEAGLTEEAAQMMMAQPVAAGGGGGGGKTTLYADINGNLFTSKNGKTEVVSPETIQNNPGKYLIDDKTYRGTIMGQTNKSGVKENSKNTVQTGQDTTKMTAGQYAAYMAQKNAKK